VRRQSENGANFRLFGGANKAMCSGRTKRRKLLFSAPFFGSFFGRAKNEQDQFGGAKEMNNNYWVSKK
jgi:hypothetical protein